MDNSSSSDAGFQSGDSVEADIGQRRGMAKPAIWIALGLAMIGSLAWALHVSKPNITGVTVDLPREAPPNSKTIFALTSLPGFSADMLVKFSDVTNPHQSRIFEYRSEEGAQVSLSLERTNRLELSIQDKQGIIATISYQVGTQKLPFNRPLHLSCEYGASNSDSAIRLLANGQTIAYQSDLPIKIRSTAWSEIEVPASRTAAELRFITAEGATLTDSERTYYRKIMLKNLDGIGDDWLMAFK